MDSQGIPFAVASDEEALKLPLGRSPAGNDHRSQPRPLRKIWRGSKWLRAMRRKWPQLLRHLSASLWPVHPRLELAAGERFLKKRFVSRR